MNYYALDEALAILEGKELSMDFYLKSVVESSKVFAEFSDVISLNEAEGSFKERIAAAIKKVIQKIKGFFTWLATKVKEFWNKLMDRIRKINLKASLEKARQRAKAKKNVSESATVLTEAKTLEELDEWLKKEASVGPIKLEADASFIAHYANRKLTKKEADDKIDVWYLTNGVALLHDTPKVLTVYEYQTNRDFVEHYQNWIADAKKDVEELEKYKSKLKEEEAKFNDALEKLNSSDISSIEDLNAALKTADKRDDIMTQLSITSGGITKITEVINIIQSHCARIESRAEKINKYLLGDADD